MNEGGRTWVLGVVVSLDAVMVTGGCGSMMRLEIDKGWLQLSFSKFYYFIFKIAHMVGCPHSLGSTGKNT